MPSLEQIQRERIVPLVVNDDQMFADALNSKKAVRELLPSDLAMLRKSYLHFWGPFWIAGFDLRQSDAPSTISVVVPGPYTVASGKNIVIDGVRHAAGAVIELERGQHTVAANAGAVRLLWGRNLRMPAQPAPSEPYFTSF